MLENLRTYYNGSKLYHIETFHQIFMSHTVCKLIKQHYLHSIGRKFISQKSIGEQNLNNHVDEVEAFAEKEISGP